MTVQKRFLTAGLLHLSELYEFAHEVGLVEVGSSSIDSSFTNAVEEVKIVLATKAGVSPSNMLTAAIWATLGDTSATFYFSGYRHIDGKNATKVDTPLFLEILSDHLDDLTKETRMKINILAKAINPNRLKDLTEIELND